MITTFLLNLIYSVVRLLTFPLRALDDVTIANSTLTTLVGQASAWFKNIDGFIPMDTFLTVFAAFFTIELLVGVYKIIMWVLRRVPGQG